MSYTKSLYWYMDDMSLSKTHLHSLPCATFSSNDDTAFVHVKSSLELQNIPFSLKKNLSKWNNLHNFCDKCLDFVVSKVSSLNKTQVAHNLQRIRGRRPRSDLLVNIASYFLQYLYGFWQYDRNSFWKILLHCQ